MKLILLPILAASALMSGCASSPVANYLPFPLSLVAVGSRGGSASRYGYHSGGSASGIDPVTMSAIDASNRANDEALLQQSQASIDQANAASAQAGMDAANAASAAAGEAGAASAAAANQ